jgi:mono/diheme cytochrome c family protein
MIRFSILLFAVTTPLFAQTNGSAERPAAGAYTSDQAALGEKAYQMYCASCHATSFHTDEQFRMNWFGRTTYDLFKILKTTMPEDNVGGLTDDEYTRVIAYILKLNGFSAGTDSLKADTLEMKRIRIAAATPDTTKHNRN